MSQRVGNIIIIAPEPDQRCELCGKIDKCRPYGPREEQVCYDCGMKNPEAVRRQINKHLFGGGNA